MRVALLRPFNILALLLAATCVLFVSPSAAVQGDCGVIATNGSKPLASDCLGILQHAVSKTGCAPFDPCVCDVDGSGSILASDALLCLNVAVGNPAFSLNCSCSTTTTTVVVSTTSSSTSSVSISTSSTSSTSTTLSAALTWTQISALFAGSCGGTGCHTAGEVNGGLGDLEQIDAGYAALVGAPAVCGGAFTTRVIAGDSINSQLMRKLDNSSDCGSSMPLGAALLPLDTRDGIRAWIDAGAPKN